MCFKLFVEVWLMYIKDINIMEIMNIIPATYKYKYTYIYRRHKFVKRSYNITLSTFFFIKISFPIKYIFLNKNARLSE